MPRQTGYATLEQMRKFLYVVLGLLIVSVGNAVPGEADELLREMRTALTSQGSRDVLGSIRKGSTRVPFSLSARGDTIAFQYKL